MNPTIISDNHGCAVLQDESFVQIVRLELRVQAVNVRLRRGRSDAIWAGVFVIVRAVDAP